MSARIVSLKQGTPEWHEHRAKYRNASETPAVVGVSPWLTAYGLWLQRTGRATQEITPAMQHGAGLEGAAREAYERLTGHVMEPLVLVDGDYSASLDGITLDGGLILEIKCPVRGRASMLWHGAQAKEVPEHYRWQMQHQLMVSGAKRAHFYVFDGREGIVIEEEPRPETWAVIRRDWDSFMASIASDAPPALSERDTREREDAAWRTAASAYLDAKRSADEASAALEVARSALVALASHPSETGGGVTVTRFWKRGAVDYKKVPQLTGVDLESFRKEARLEVRVTTE
jgi:putative phage-type endonuclease